MSLSKKLIRQLMIKPDELGEIRYFLLLFLLLGFGIAIGRGTAYALFFKQYGIEHLPVMYLLLGGLLMLLSLLYAAYSDRLSPERMFRVLLSSLTVLVFANWCLMSQFNLAYSYPAYFLLFELASEFLVVHFSLYLGQNLDALQAKRLTPIVFAGFQIGTMLGGTMLAAGASQVGAGNMVLVWCMALIVSLVTISRHHRRFGVSRFFRCGAVLKNRKKAIVDELWKGAKFAGRSRLLRAMSLALLFMVFATYVLTYTINLVYVEAVDNTDELTVLFGSITAVTGLFALFLQLFATSRIIHFLGVGRSNLIYPVTTLLCFLGLLASFSMPAALLGSLNKEALLSAFRNPVRNLFFNALPGYMLGRARAVGIVLIVPVALTITGTALLLIGDRESNLVLLLLGALAALLYIYFSSRMSNAYTREIILTLKEKVHLPQSRELVSISESDKELLDEIAKGIDNSDEEIRGAYARMLLAGDVSQAVSILLPRLQTFSVSMQDQIICRISSDKPEALSEYIAGYNKVSDNHLRATIYGYLVHHGNESAVGIIEEALNDPDPRIKTVGIGGALSLPVEKLIDQARQAWRGLLGSDRISENLAGLDLLARVHEVGFAAQWLVLIEKDDARVLEKALLVLEQFPVAPASDLFVGLQRAYASPDQGLRARVVLCSVRLSHGQKMAILYQALDDKSSSVRKAAIEVLATDHEDFIGFLFDSIASQKYSLDSQKDLLVEWLRHSPKRSRIDEIAEKKAGMAMELLQIKSFICALLRRKPGDQRLELVDHVISERLEQLLELILTVLQTSEDAESIEVIRAALRSKDARFVANAAEALHNMADHKLAHDLDRIIEGLQATVSKHPMQTGRYKTLDEVQRWCHDSNDIWMGECITWATNRTENASV